MNAFRLILLAACLLCASCQRAPQAIAPQTSPVAESLVVEIPGAVLERDPWLVGEGKPPVLQPDNPARMSNWEELARVPDRGNSSDILAPSGFGTRSISIEEHESNTLAALQEGSNASRFRAARWSWEHRRDQHADAVLRFPREFTPDSGDELKFKLLLAPETLPAAVLKDLQAVDAHEYARGLWLAQVKPGPAFVPDLIAGLERQPRMQGATLEALGKMRDARGFGTLVSFLLSANEQLAPIAARALGDLGQSDAEPYLLSALGRQDDSAMQLAVCQALGKVGTPLSIPTLEKLAHLPESTLEANITREAAQTALKAIAERGI